MIPATQLCSQRLQGRTCRPCRLSRRTVQTKALFGFGKSNADVEREKQEQYAAQQEIIKRRKTGQDIKDAVVRRKQVKETIEAKKAERKEERRLLAQGIIPETLKKWQPYDKETEANSRSGIVIPQVPFGLVKYDEGERFDLRNPFLETGYVDPDEMSPWDSLKRFGKKVFDFSKDGAEIEKEAKKQVYVMEVDDKRVPKNKK